MPPKPSAAAATNEEVEEGLDPSVVLQNYDKFVKLIGIPKHPRITQALTPAAEGEPVDKLIIDDSAGPLGAAGTRALCTSLLGIAPGMKGGPYKLLKQMHLWRVAIGDDGAASVAELLRLGGGELKLQYLELFDNNIGPRGASALGRALSRGQNLSLLTLKLDYNPTLGTEGCIALCQGLRTNTSLKQLHLCYCGIDAGAGEALGEVLSFPQSTLTVMNLKGNRLAGPGLFGVARGMVVSPKLEKIILADNMIGLDPADMRAMEMLRDALIHAPALTHIDMLFNRIGEENAVILQPALTGENKRVKEFLLDSTLPMPLFESLFRRDAGGKKGKKGGKKKK